MVFRVIERIGLSSGWSGKMTCAGKMPGGNQWKSTTVDKISQTSEEWYFSIYSFDRKQLFDIMLCYWFRFSFLLVRCYVVDNSIICKRYMAVPSLFWYHYLYPLSCHCFAKYLFMIFLSMLFIFYRFEAEHVRCVQS